MRYNIIKNIFLSSVLMLFSSYSSFANSGEEQHGGEPKQEEADFSGHQSQDWEIVQKKLGEVKGKMDAQESVVSGLLLQKRQHEATLTPLEIENLKTEHQKLQVLQNEYNALLAEFNYKYPEKGLNLGRKYQRSESQSLEVMEQSLSFEGRLNKLNKKIKKQYTKTKKSSEHGAESKKIITEDLTSTKKTQSPQKNDVTEKIILVK